MNVNKREIKFILSEYEGGSTLTGGTKTMVEVRIGGNHIMRRKSMSEVIKAVDNYVNDRNTRRL